MGCGRPLCLSGDVCSKVNGRQLARSDSMVGMMVMCACCAEFVGQATPMVPARQRLAAWHVCAYCTCVRIAQTPRFARGQQRQQQGTLVWDSCCMLGSGVP